MKTYLSYCIYLSVGCSALQQRNSMYNLVTTHTKPKLNLACIFGYICRILTKVKSDGQSNSINFV